MCQLTHEERLLVVEVLRTHASCIEHATRLPSIEAGPAYGRHYADYMEAAVRAESLAAKLLAQ